MGQFGSKGGLQQIAPIKNIEQKSAKMLPIKSSCACGDNGTCMCQVADTEIAPLNTHRDYGDERADDHTI